MSEVAISGAARPQSKAAEASETRAQTAKEAQSGDIQAQQKLAAAQSAPKAGAASEEASESASAKAAEAQGKGKEINLSA